MSTYFRTEIVEAIRQGNAAFVIGAGVSVSASEGNAVASWAGLMESGIDRCVDLDPTLPKKWSTTHRRAIKGNDASAMIRTAEEVQKELKNFPGQYYAKWLADTVGNIRALSPGIVQVLNESGAPLLTTNYDEILESITGRTPVTWQDFPNMQQEINSPGSYVVHLHGYWRRPDSVVFGYTNYGEVLKNPGAQAFLRSLLTVKAVIFIGFGQGLFDPNFSALCSWLTTNLPDTSLAPFALVRESEYQQRRVEYRPHGINVVSYGSAYSDLEIFLSDIVREARQPVVATDITTLGWDTLSAQLGRLHRRITRDFQPDLIVAMSGPGNFAPAYCLRHSADDPPLFSAVTFPRRPGRSSHNLLFGEIARDDGWFHYESDKWDVFLPPLVGKFPKGARALIFDDRVINGRVQAWVADLLKDFGYEVRRAAIVVHPKSAPNVNFYEKEIEGDFTFPWGGKLGRGEPAP
ncbi:SIR2 family protein [Streptomyces sp. NBC_00457]|uniref:SIR2 family protein n=1 Tax=Streptomyces sp. NBC_00457 TaxID=2975748 RepID=UPI002E217AB7